MKVVTSVSWAIACLASVALPAAAQRDQLPPGVELATRYTVSGRPALSVQPFVAPGIISATAAQITGIIENDLRISDRFEVRPTPESLARGAIDYPQWNALNIVWVVAGDVLATPTGFRVTIALHDVVYGNAKETRTFALPTASSPDFRMATHAISDEIVRWVFGQLGMAASRIAYVRQNGNGRYDLLLVDSDGEDLRRIGGSDHPIYSPSWAPDGTRLAYTVKLEEGWQMVERDMATGRTRVVLEDPNVILTPRYSPDGTRMAFATWSGNGFEIREMDATGNGEVRTLTNSAGDNLSPAYSPDGQNLVFHSTRTGRQHIYTMPASGGNATVLTPFGEGVEYAGPEWSPTGTEVTFHGRSRGGVYQIMLANASRPGGRLEQLTREGENEDPSWAPDGRHIVYSSGVRRGSPGLYVIDTRTGSIRSLVTGGRLRIADWSPSLAAPFLEGTR